MTESSTVRVDPANIGQLRAWDGDQGQFWAERADRFNEGAARYDDHFLAAAAIGPTSKVLDIGCGSGKTTRDAARRATAGSALGVDLSSQGIALARELAEGEGLGNATFLQADAQVHPFPPDHFDVAISRHGAMFFGDAPAAFANIARAISPGGHLVLLTWQPAHRNEWITTFRAAFDLPAPPPDEPGSLKHPEQIHPLLATAGFIDVDIQGLIEPMYFGQDVDDASTFITAQFGRMLTTLPAETQAKAVESIRTDMTTHQTPDGVLYNSAAWLITATRP